jgi:hypothetical protein
MKRSVLRDRSVAARCFRSALLIVFCMSLAVTGCHRSADPAKDVSVHVNITPQPVHTGMATVTIQLADPAAAPISHAHISVEADMSHPGMAPVFADAAEALPGSYQAHLDFNMGGDWVVLLHIRLADGRKIERQIDVHGVESN